MEANVELQHNGAICTLWLNDPDSKNALSPALVHEFTQALETVLNDHSVRVLVVRGRGDGFCSGANLSSFAKTGKPEMELEVLKESRALANLFYQLNHLSKPVVTVVHGYAFGGALGLIAASDYTLVEEKIVMSFSEVRLGLVPATIMPYVAQRLSAGKMRELMLTGRRFSSEEGFTLGLVSEVVPTNKVEERLNKVLKDLLAGAPNAQTTCKTLIAETRCNHSFVQMADATSRILAEMRLGEEAREGISAFLEKRKAAFNRSGEL